MLVCSELLTIAMHKLSFLHTTSTARLGVIRLTMTKTLTTSTSSVFESTHYLVHYCHQNGDQETWKWQGRALTRQCSGVQSRGYVTLCIYRLLHASALKVCAQHLYQFRSSQINISFVTLFSKLP